MERNPVSFKDGIVKPSLTVFSVQLASRFRDAPSTGEICDIPRVKSWRVLLPYYTKSSNVKLPQKIFWMISLSSTFYFTKTCGIIDIYGTYWYLRCTLDYLGYFKKKDQLAKHSANLTGTEVWKSLTTTRWSGGRFLKPSSRRAEGTPRLPAAKMPLLKCDVLQKSDLSKTKFEMFFC